MFIIRILSLGMFEQDDDFFRKEIKPYAAPYSSGLFTRGDMVHIVTLALKTKTADGQTLSQKLNLKIQ